MLLEVKYFLFGFPMADVMCGKYLVGLEIRDGIIMIAEGEDEMQLSADSRWQQKNFRRTLNLF